MGNSINKFILDIGNSTIKLLAGELTENGSRLRVLSYQEVETQGMRKNIIENPIALSDCIKKAAKLVEEESGLKVEKVALGYGGTHIFSRTKNVKVDFGKERIISQNDVENLFDIAHQELCKNNEELLERELYNTRINNGGLIKNPIGMIGRYFQGDVHLIFIKREELNDLLEVVHRAGLEVEATILNSYAAARATLKDEDKKNGVALIDIGGGSTDIIIYKNNKLIYTKSLPIGGKHYISDLCYIYNLSPEEAQSIVYKLAPVRDGKYILNNKQIDTKIVSDAINARSSDFINLIRKTIDESGFQGYLEKGIYLTGGVTKMDEMYDWINIKIGYPVTKVTPLKLGGAVHPTPEMSVCIGILLEIMEKEYLEIKRKEKLKSEEKQNSSNDNDTSSKKISNNENNDKTSENPSENTKKKESIWKKWFSNFI